MFEASLGKQPTSHDATTGCPRNDDGCRNSIPMACHLPHLGSASDWSVPRGKFASTNQISQGNQCLNRNVSVKV